MVIGGWGSASPAQKPKGRVSGDGVAVRLPNNPTVRSVRRHIHCTSVYVCSPIAANIVGGRHKTSDRPQQQKPRVSGALTWATEGLGARAARCHQSNNNAAISFPSKTKTAEGEAFPPSPNGARPALRLPPVPTGMGERSFRKMAKGRQEF